MGKILKTALFAACACLLFSLLDSCNTTGCTDNQNALPLAGLYSYETGKSVTVDSIEIGGIGAPNDSLLYDASEKMSVVYLPFRSTASTSAFYFRYAQKALATHNVADTLTFTYSSSPYFVSEDCGAMYYYRISSLSYTRHVIDSIAITDSLVTNSDTERLKIFFRTGDSPL